jgi:hypothetical protein
VGEKAGRANGRIQFNTILREKEFTIPNQLPHLNIRQGFVKCMSFQSQAAGAPPRLVGCGAGGESRLVKHQRTLAESFAYFS